MPGSVWWDVGNAGLDSGSLMAERQSCDVDICAFVAYVPAYVYTRGASGQPALITEAYAAQLLRFTCWLGRY